MAIFSRLFIPSFFRTPSRGLWINPTNPARHLTVGFDGPTVSNFILTRLQDTEEKRRQIYRTIDRTGFDWQVFLVAASGFLTESYNLFATNVILPSIAYVYWPDPASDPYRQKETAINAITLAGSAIGMLLFGYLADRYGRRKLYGLELILVIVSTLGLTQASEGYRSNGTSSTSMNILGWLLFYRLFQGIGIGAEYPLSATIAAEFAPVGSRARMMAAVFLMQPLGQILAAVVGLCVAIGYNNWANIDVDAKTPEDLLRKTILVDSIWRWVIGVGAIPGLIAILFRLTIPESPRYTLDVDEDADRALNDARTYYPSLNSVGTAETGDMVPVARESLGPDHTDNGSMAGCSFRLDGPGNSPEGAAVSPLQSLREPSIREPTRSKHRFWHGLWSHLFVHGNWRWLAGTSLSWFLLDFAYYGLGINNPRTLAKIWAPQAQQDAVMASWNSGLVNGTTPISTDANNIYYVLKNDALRYIVTSGVGALVGSLILIKIIPYVSRRVLLYWSFGALFVVLLVTGATLFATFETSLHALTIAFYVLTQLIFNLGPNTLLFIIPAEIFPTRYRATCYGISAASGKVASVVVQSFLPSISYNSNVGDAQFNNQTVLAIVLMVFSGVMLAGGFVAWLWIPEVQNGRAAGNGYDLPSKTLEELAVGWSRDEEDSEGVGRRRAWVHKPG